MNNITNEQLDGLIKSAVNSSGPLPPDEKFSQIISALRELRELRAAMLQGGNSPVIPDDVLSAIRKVARIRADFDDFDGDRRGIGDCLDEAEQDLIVTINKHASVIAAAPRQEVK
ncbi:hypothetical protein DN555_09860 [Enterobacter asburiae]|nr:hypothetical protein [Enterobacter asburiae]CZW93902.1 Uncharacterised protein [Enterobacter cloacae]EKW1578436.1 hypothetical protein [Enterobacter asburiae]ELW9471462.1 hypothetical protein [Enterobacter asburiae]MDC6395853.1 hypothetical protein [Enterobacter asburiae]MDC6403639.1 hypothetical protein [Enterobacter asburiae]